MFSLSLLFVIYHFGWKMQNSSHNNPVNSDDPAPFCIINKAHQQSSGKKTQHCFAFFHLSSILGVSEMRDEVKFNISFA
jgi:hypothetical protein